MERKCDQRYYTGLLLAFLLMFFSVNALCAEKQQWYVSYMGVPEEYHKHKPSWQKEDRRSASPKQGGMYEVTQYPTDTEATEEQKKAAFELVQNCYKAASEHGWFDFNKGQEDGFLQMDETHYENETFIHDGEVLNPDRPEYLMYYETSEGKKLAGFMFLTKTLMEHGPQIGGPLTVWHYHVWGKAVCIHGDSEAKAADASDCVCPFAELNTRSREMLHVWLVEHPEGRFAANMTLPDEVIEQLKDQ